MACYFLYAHLNLIVFSSILISQTLAFTLPPEVSALQDLYRALNYPPALQGWNGSDPCGESWKGVACSESSVIHIKIQGLNLTGFLGSMLNNLHNLKELDVSSNNILGEIPFGLPPNVTHMNLSHNCLIGPIGNVFTDLHNLEELDLSYNNFLGDLPCSFGSLTSLARLFLQNNKFTGSVAYLAELPLTDLNIQDNLFSGILPHHFQSIQNLWIGGNKFHATDNSPPWTFPWDTLQVDHNISHPPTATTQANAIKNYAPPKVSEHKKKHIGPGGIALMVGGGTLLATCLTFFVAIRLNKLRAQSFDLKNFESNHISLHSHPTSATIEISSAALDESPQIPPSYTASLLGPMRLPSLHHKNVEESARRSFSRRRRFTGKTNIYTEAELQLATNNFNEGNLLGEGSLGPVYIAKFTDGKVLAVKNIAMAGQSFREEEKFLDVICTASRLKHPNIVALNGYCLERRKHLLVYDYVGNLTLGDALHSGACKPLSWIHRLRIAVGVAQALDYLHSACCPPVAHGNLKAANVLLDENFMPRVCDCSLAILRPLRSDLVQIPAPEIIGRERGYCSRRKDVFAFGVLLLELLTGRKPLDGYLFHQSCIPFISTRCQGSWTELWPLFQFQHSARPSEEQYLVKLASPKLHDIVDPSMKRTFSSNELSCYADIISLCIQPLKQFRPPMSEVVDSLVSFSQKFSFAKSDMEDGADFDLFERSFHSTNTCFIGSPVLSHVSA